MVKYIVGFVVLFVLILYLSFVGLDRKSHLVTETQKPKVQQSEGIQSTEVPKNKEMQAKASERKPVYFPSTNKAMVGGAEVEWVEPNTALDEGEFGTPPE